MKNFVFIALISLLSPFCFSQSVYYVSADNGLFARIAPNQGAKSLAKLNYGTKVEILENTNLNLDVLDAGEKKTGQWVKVKAYVQYEDIEAYVFNAYLTEKKLETRSIVPFEKFNAVIHALELWESEHGNRSILKDTAQYYVELGETPENKMISIKPLKHYKKIEVYQSFQTSLTIMNEGSHCDLLDWAHYDSPWTPLESTAKNTFKTLTYSPEDWNRFVNVDMAKLKQAVKDKCGEDYAKLVSKIRSVNDYPAGVSISIIHLKIVMTDLDNNRIEKIISFEIPMGC